MKYEYESDYTNTSEMLGMIVAGGDTTIIILWFTVKIFDKQKIFEMIHGWDLVIIQDRIYQFTWFDMCEVIVELVRTLEHSADAADAAMKTIDS